MCNIHLDMFNYSQDGVTVTSMLDSRKANKDKLFPIKIRVTYRRERKYYSTGKAIDEKGWVALPNARTRTAADMREEIQDSFDSVKRVVVGLIKEGAFSLDSLDLRVGRSVSGTLNQAFQSKIAELSAESRAGSELYYKNVLSSINRFKGNSIKFQSITPEWLRKYEKWLLDSKLTYSSVGMYMRAIRAMVNVAIADGSMKKADYPFGPTKYVIPTGDSRNIALKLSDIKRVIDYTDGLETTERYRDLWFLSYLLNGINIGDLIKLKDSNFWNGEVRWYRTKTIRTTNKKRELIAVVTPEITAIINRWGVPGRKRDDYIFPYLKGGETAMQEKKIILDVVKRINNKMKLIAKALEMPEFTTYSARHSFATILKRAGANIAYISESLGHPDVKTTEHYLDKFETEERQKNAAFLTKFDAEKKDDNF